MWVLKMFRPMLPGETMEAALARLTKLPGVVVVDRGEPLPVTYSRSGELNGLTPAEVQLLVQNPGLLPLDVRLAWVDDVVANHLREEGEAVRAAYQQTLEEVRLAQGLGDVAAAKGN